MQLVTTIKRSLNNIADIIIDFFDVDIKHNLLIPLILTFIFGAICGIYESIMLYKKYAFFDVFILKAMISVTMFLPIIPFFMCFTISVELMDDSDNKISLLHFLIVFILYGLNLIIIFTFGFYLGIDGLFVILLIVVGIRKLAKTKIKIPEFLK